MVGGIHHTLSYRKVFLYASARSRYGQENKCQKMLFNKKVVRLRTFIKI